MKPCPMHKRRLCNVCGQCHQCYPQLGPEAHDPRTLAAIRRGVAITATLLFLAVAAQAQEPTPSPTPAPCFNCASARVRASALMLWSSSGATPTLGSVSGIVHAEMPALLKSGASLGRPYVSFSFLSVPGQALPVPGTFQSLEGEAGWKYYLAGNATGKLGLTCSVWANQKLNAASQEPLPTQPATYGWGCGPVALGAEHSHVSLQVGRDNYAGDQGGVQIRTRAKLSIPHTDTAHSDGPIGSLYVDARLTLVSAPAAGGVVSPRTLNSTISYGVAVNADSVWSAIFGKS